MTIRYLAAPALVLLSLAFASSTSAQSTWKSAWPPLHTAVNQGNLAEVRRLLEERVDVNARAALGKTPLFFALSPHRACLAGPCQIASGLSDDYRVIVALLIEHGANVNEKNDSGGTALMSAAACNAVDIAELLIDNGADMDIREHQYTALEMAAYRGPDVAILMVRRGANVNAQDPYTKTSPLHTAASCGYRELVEELLRHGANPNVKDQWGSTPLERAKDPSVIDAIKRHLETSNRG